jgi:hypothetical protein
MIIQLFSPIENEWALGEFLEQSTAFGKRIGGENDTEWKSLRKRGSREVATVEGVDCPLKMSDDSRGEDEVIVVKRSGLVNSWQVYIDSEASKLDGHIAQNTAMAVGVGQIDLRKDIGCGDVD